MIDDTLSTKTKNAFLTLVPTKVVQSRLQKKTYMQFAEKVGLVYFGYVDQRHDEHKLVRGLTLSSEHRDTHYCIGDFDGYDVTLVNRVDTIRYPGKQPRTHDWIIMTFDLHTPVDLPHIFLGLHTHSDTFYAHLFTKFSQMMRVPLGTFDNYDSEFTSKYAIYTQPAKMIAAEQLFDKKITRTIADHFGNLTIEISDQCLYVYAEHQRPSMALLEKMIKYGGWLAQSIDHKMQQDTTY